VSFSQRFAIAAYAPRPQVVFSRDPEPPMSFGRLTLLAALALAPAAVHAQAADPAAAMTAYNDGVIAIMKAKLPIDGRVTRFETLVAQSYDMPGIAQLVVGPKWSAATPADKKAVIDALTHHSAVSLARNFVAFNGETFKVDPAVVSRGTSSVVKVTIAGKGSSNLLQYRLRQTPAGWRIVDVVSQGVSQLALQRAELASTIASDGVGGMAKKLAARDAELIRKP
jgi:phospholipid transport system substrate-binding protein